MIISKHVNQIIDNRKRIAAIFILLVVLLFLLFSTYFIAHEADHDCTGESCPVCALFQISENNLRQLGGGVLLAMTAVSLILIIMVLHLDAYGDIIASTPVSRKTRLNN